MEHATADKDRNSRLGGRHGPAFAKRNGCPGSSIDCDSLIVPAIYLHRARNYTFINPYFYQRNNEDGSQVAIEMTAGSRSNLIISPSDDSSGTTAELVDDVIDAGENNEIQWTGRPAKPDA